MGGTIGEGCPGVGATVSLGVDGFIPEHVGEVDSSIALTFYGAAIEFDRLSTGCGTEGVMAMVGASLGGRGKEDRA